MGVHLGKDLLKLRRASIIRVGYVKETGKFPSDAASPAEKCSVYGVGLPPSRFNGTDRESFPMLKTALALLLV